jgi:hypothetical protein
MLPRLPGAGAPAPAKLGCAHAGMAVPFPALPATAGTPTDTYSTLAAQVPSPLQAGRTRAAGPQFPTTAKLALLAGKQPGLLSKRRRRWTWKPRWGLRLRTSVSVRLMVGIDAARAQALNHLGWWWLWWWWHASSARKFLPSSSVKECGTEWSGVCLAVPVSAQVAAAQAAWERSVAEASAAQAAAEADAKTLRARRRRARLEAAAAAAANAASPSSVVATGDSSSVCAGPDTHLHVADGGPGPGTLGDRPSPSENGGALPDPLPLADSTTAFKEESRQREPSVAAVVVPVLPRHGGLAGVLAGVCQTQVLDLLNLDCELPSSLGRGVAASTGLSSTAWAAAAAGVATAVPGGEQRAESTVPKGRNGEGIKPSLWDLESELVRFIGPARNFEASGWCLCTSPALRHKGCLWTPAMRLSL